MARARNIKPGFFTNEELVEVPFATRLLFIGLWTLADRAGRLEDKPKKIKMSLFPADNLDIDDCLDDLQAHGFVLRYRVQDVPYIQVLAFGKHQNPHKDEKASIIPAPCEHGASTVLAPDQHCGNPADSLIPDSPIPEAPTASAVPAEPAARCSAVQLSIAANAAGVRTQPANPVLLAMAAQGVTPETVTAACDEAKRAKPDEVIGFGYVAKIIERWARDAAAVSVAGAAPPQKSAGAWWASDASIIAKGEEMALRPLAGESIFTFKGRIEAAIANGGKPPEARAAPVSSTTFQDVPKGKKPDGWTPPKIERRDKAA